MKELVFLLEEPSAKAMLESVLPRLLTEGMLFRLIPFEGKQDLERQMTRKIRAYQNHQARFIVVRDQDSNPNCLQLKQRLLNLCQDSGKQDKCIVRIACTELESFYLADLQAVERGLGISGISSKQQTKKFRAPDNLSSPSRELKTLTRHRYEKVIGSRAIGQHLQLDNDRSRSFRNLIAGIRRMEKELLALDS